AAADSASASDATARASPPPPRHASAAKPSEVDAPTDSVRIRGRVVDAGGAPVPSARVSVRPPSTRTRTTWTDEADMAAAFAAPPPRSVAVDRDGAFDAAAPRGRDVVLRAEAPGFASASALVDAAADRDGVVVRLSIGAAVSGVVTD